MSTVLAHLLLVDDEQQILRALKPALAAAGYAVATAETGHEAMLETILADVAAGTKLPALAEWQPPAMLHEDPPRDFTDGVERILDYLAAGDVFQANLSRGWRAMLD